MTSSINWNTRWTTLPNTYGMYKTKVGDVDNNGTQDIFAADCYSDNNGRADSGSVYIIKNELFSSNTGTGNTASLTDSSKWNIRIDGAAANNWLGCYILEFVDMNNDGKRDIIVEATGVDTLQTNGGAVYIIDNSIFANMTGTGNTIDLSDSTKWSVRYDGNTSNGYLGLQQIEGTIGDFDNDGKNDLVLADYLADNNSRTNSGSVYLIYNTLIDDYTGTGNAVSLANTANYNVRYDGATSGDLLGYASVGIGDINNDGKDDIALSAGEANLSGFTSAGSLYLIYNDLITSNTGTGNTIDLSVSSTFNIRYDGYSTYDYAGTFFKGIGDLNGNGDNDLTFSLEGSQYIIYDSLLASYVGTGNIMTLSPSATSRYNIRFSPPTGSSGLGSLSGELADLDQDGVLDIILSDVNADSLSKTHNGIVIVIFHSTFASVTGTGNTIDLNSNANYNVWYDGSTNFHYLGSDVEIADVDGDGSKDLLLTETNVDGVTPTKLYLIYYFPHTITHTETVGDIRHPFTFKGLVTASNSPTTITRVQWGHTRSFGNLAATVASDFANAWIDCAADDGSFNSTSENFSCSHSALDGRNHFTIPHGVFIRAQDSKGVWTTTSQYLAHTFSLVDSPGEASPTKDPQIQSGSGGIFPLQNLPGTQKVVLVTPEKAFDFAAYISANTTQSGSSFKTYSDSSLRTVRGNSLLAGSVLGINTSGISWQVGSIQEIWYRDFYNNAKILPSIQKKASIVSLTYSDQDLIPAGKPKSRFNAKNLKLAYSADGRTWRIIPTSVVDTKNHSVAALHKVGGYYMIVGK